MSTTKIINAPTGAPGATGTAGTAGAIGAAGADGTTATLDLERRFRLLLKSYFLTFGQLPPGLESEIAIAISTN